MPETPARQTDLFQDSAPPQADALALFQHPAEQVLGRPWAELTDWPAGGPRVW